MHPVKEALRQLTKLVQSPPVAALNKAFSEAGYELALVGGPVRDAFVGVGANDLDFATNARPETILTIVKPISQSHWDIGREFGTIGALIKGERVEITTYRQDRYDGTSRKPVVAFGDELEGDLLRRDFTVNALALSLPELTLVDPTGGIEDLMAGVLRTPIEPELSFGDDPLRMMRAVRFASQLGFQLDLETFEAIGSMCRRILDISSERVRDELIKLFSCAKPRAGFELFVETGLAELVFPEIPALQLEHDEVHQHKDVFEHSLKVMENAIQLECQAVKNPDSQLTSPDLVLRMAALLHDIGKPKTRQFSDNGRVTFHGHDWVGAKLTKKRLSALRFDNETIKQVARLVELHMRLYNYGDAGWTDSAVRRFARDAGPLLERLFLLIRSDITTRNRRKSERLQFGIDNMEERLAKLREQEAIDAIRPDLDGEDIMQILGIGPSRQVGEARNFLLELRLDEGPLGRSEATARLKAWWQAKIERE